MSTLSVRVMKKAFVYRLRGALTGLFCLPEFAELMNVRESELPDKAIVTASTSHIRNAATTWVKWNQPLGGEWKDWQGRTLPLLWRAVQKLEEMGIPESTWTRLWITYREDK